MLHLKDKTGFYIWGYSAIAYNGEHISLLFQAVSVPSNDKHICEGLKEI
jgi:hypothetical protein